MFISIRVEQSKHINYLSGFILHAVTLYMGHRSLGSLILGCYLFIDVVALAPSFTYLDRIHRCSGPFPCVLIPELKCSVNTCVNICMIII